MPLEPGTKLGAYEILEAIGAGGMGEVYRARDRKLERDVAIKVLPKSLVRRRSLDRFEREAKAVAALSHPNILAIHDFVKDPELSYAVTELLEGETLRERLEKGPLPRRQAVDFTVQICRGLDAAHGKGITHRDLKPDNIYLTKDGLVKILDFGLAKVENPTLGEDEDAPTRARDTRPGTVLGTIGYMSPEQVRGHDADHRSDIFSLGTILYEMLTVERAFKGQSAADTMSAILKEDPPALASSQANIPMVLRKILHRCLDKDPGERFQSARDLRFALETISDVKGESDSGKGTSTAAERALSVAVLPFKDMSPQKNQEYFCEGMAEEILNALTHVQGLRVAARSSAFRFSGKAQDVRQVGEALGVGHLLEGSVRTSGTRLRVTAQLVSAADGYHVWSERYDRDMEDVFAIQDEIASNIVAALRLKLRGDAVEPVQRRSTNLEAYHLYLKGRHAFERRYRGGPHNAIPFFEQAVEKDPSYALAYAGLGDCYTMLGVYGFVPPKEAYEKVQAAVKKALDIDDRVAEAHTTLARFLCLYEGTWEECEREFQQALELNPSDVQAWCWYSVFLAFIGRHEEAVAKVMKAVELDPLSPYAHAVVGVTHALGGYHQDAIAACQKALEMDPDHSVALWLLGQACGRAGQYDRAIDVLARVAELTGRASFYVAWLAWALGVAGRGEEARTLLAELHERAKKEYVAPVFFASVHSGLLENDQVMEWLKRAEEERSPFRIFLGFASFDNMRDDPRFQELLRQWGLPSS